jgi:glucose/arabinose dehydrogenase
VTFLPSLVACLLLLAGLVSGCADGGSGDLQEPPPVAAVTVTAPADTLEVGRTLQLAASPLDARGSQLEGRTVEWSTVPESVASVSETGLVTALSPGDVEVRATSEGVVGSLLLTVLAQPPVPPSPPPGPVTLGLEPVATGLAFPVYLTSPPGDARLFILEKGGAIRIVKGGTLLDAPFLDLGGRVSRGREQGLLGLAFPPDYASTGRFVVHYTDTAGDTRLSSYRVSDDPDRADPATETVLLAVRQPAPNHNGGQITFGPDGYLYLGLGDGGGRGDPNGNGQRITDLLGAILRFDLSSGAAVPPADNPFVGRSDAEPAIWSYGLRNPWRFSFDRATGDLYIADVGEGAWEEIDVAGAAVGGGRGVNYGWNRMEGTHCYAAPACDTAGLTLPLVEYDHGQGCSVTGGYVYRGAAIPALQGHYFYGDFCAGWVRSFRVEDGQAVDHAEWPALATGGAVVSFGEDQAGELYVLSDNGTVSRIVGSAAPLRAGF